MKIKSRVSDDELIDPGTKVSVARIYFINNVRLVMSIARGNATFNSFFSSLKIYLAIQITRTPQKFKACQCKRPLYCLNVLLNLYKSIDYAFPGHTTKQRTFEPVMSSILFLNTMSAKPVKSIVQRIMRQNTGFK